MTERFLSESQSPINTLFCSDVPANAMYTEHTTCLILSNGNFSPLFKLCSLHFLPFDFVKREIALLEAYTNYLCSNETDTFVLRPI